MHSRVPPEICVKVSQDDIVDRQAVLNIEVDTESLEKHLDQAFRRLVDKVVVPGFRKGKAPRIIFERAYGRDRLVDDALETMVPEVVDKAIEETKLEKGGTPRIEVLERDPEPKIKATVPLVPLVELGEYRSISFDERPEEVTDEQVDESLERVREGQASWEPKESAVEADDMAVLQSVEGKAAGKEIFSSRDVEYVVFAEATYPVPGFSTEIIGMKSGDTKQFSLILPDDYPDKDAAGKTAEFKVIVSEVKRKILPDLDDELANAVGEGFDTIEELKSKVRKDLEKQSSEFFKRQIEDKAVDAVIEISRVEIPPLTLDHESEHVLTEQQQQLSRYNVSLQDYMSGIGKSTDDLVAEARETAKARLTRALIVEELSTAESIEVSDEQLREEIDRLKQAATSPADRASYETDNARESISTMIRRRSALERLLEIVTPDKPKKDPSKRSAKPAKGAKKSRTASKAKSTKVKSAKKSTAKKSGAGAAESRGKTSARKPASSAAARK